MGGSKQNNQLKRPQDDEPAHEDQPPAHRARLEILCSFAHRNLDQGEDTRQEAKEIKQLIQAANEASASTSWKRQPQQRPILTQPSGTTTGRFGWQKRGAEQIPPELTADQVLSRKKGRWRTFKSAECMRS